MDASFRLICVAGHRVVGANVGAGTGTADGAGIGMDDGAGIGTWVATGGGRVKN